MAEAPMTEEQRAARKAHVEAFFVEYEALKEKYKLRFDTCNCCGIWLEDTNAIHGDGHGVPADIVWHCEDGIKYD